MISSKIERTIVFYAGILGMTVTCIVQNRDAPMSTHIFRDMGGGNLMAYFEFPERGDAQAVRGIGAMHHAALQGTSKQYAAITSSLKNKHSIYGNEYAGSVFFCVLENILLEVRT